MQYIGWMMIAQQKQGSALVERWLAEWLASGYKAVHWLNDEWLNDDWPAIQSSMNDDWLNDAWLNDDWLNDDWLASRYKAVHWPNDDWSAGDRQYIPWQDVGQRHRYRVELPSSESLLLLHSVSGLWKSTTDPLTLSLSLSLSLWQLSTQRTIHQGQSSSVLVFKIYSYTVFCEKRENGKNCFLSHFAHYLISACCDIRLVGSGQMGHKQLAEWQNALISFILTWVFGGFQQSFLPVVSSVLVASWNVICNQTGVPQHHNHQAQLSTSKYTNSQYIITYHQINTYSMYKSVNPSILNISLNQYIFNV